MAPVSLATQSFAMLVRLLPRAFVNSEGQRVYLSYEPSKALAGVTCALFFAMAAIFTFQLFRNRGKYMIVLIFACYVYAIGVVLRFPLRTHLTSRGLFIAENLLVIVAPCGFIATEYMILGRLAVWLQCTRHLLVPANRITMVFLLSDIATFLLQGAGAGLVASKQKANVGEDLLKAGIIIQLISFCIFVLFLLWFLFKVCTVEHKAWSKDSGNGFMHDWRSLACAISWSCICILVRNVYRLVEFFEGPTSHLQTQEGWFFGFDCLALFLALIVLIPFWPGRFIPDGLDLKVVASSDHETIVEESNYSMDRLRK